MLFLQWLWIAPPEDMGFAFSILEKLKAVSSQLEDLAAFRGSTFSFAGSFLVHVFHP